MIWYDVPNASMRDKIHSIIKNFENALPEQFEETSIAKCEKCNGSGLKVFRGSDQTISVWQPGDYCKSCRGFGYTGFDRVYNSYICKSCNGKGCSKCDDTGMIDWVRNIMGEK